jgi:hypothetical protein
MCLALTFSNGGSPKLPDRRFHRWFVIPTLPRVSIVYTETREQAQWIVAELPYQRDRADAV